MKRFSTLIVLFLSAMMIATSCKKDDDDNNANTPEPTPDPTPVEEEKAFTTVPLSITISIEPIVGSISGVETKKAFADGDVIEISNPDVLYEPLTISANGNAGKASANFTAELKVKKGVELVSGTTKLSAVLKNGNNYNNGKPLADVKLIEKPTDGLDQYCCWSCEDFTYTSAANAITLAPSTVFVELNMLKDDVIIRVGNADFTETISGSKLYAVPCSTKVEIPNANFEMLLDGNEQSIYHITASAPDECISHLFSIGEDKRVFFSSGNLQYRPLDGAWRLAPQQYHTCFVGWLEYLDSVGENYADWMGEDKWTDLFLVGMWIEGGFPNVMSGEYADYTLPLDENGEINAPCAYGAQWMVLSCAEWDYLMEKRPDAEHKRGGAVVDGVSGWIVLPDDWVAPDGLTFVPDYEEVDTNEDIPNQYTTDEWAAMEAVGAVFLPNTGLFMGTCYWDALPFYQSRSVEESRLVPFVFSPSYNDCYSYDENDDGWFVNGLAVRLVQLQASNKKVNVE